MPKQKNTIKRLRQSIFTLAFCLFASPVLASTPIDLTELSLEALMNIEVTTVGKKEQRLFEAAAAVFVLTQEDLLRSGVRTLPDALRLVPGLYVGRVDANKWALTSRGFTGLFSNKLLVMIDGRSVYTPLFSGVFWEAVDVPLTDVERIEVIRGSGGALWGANAVNGIINIITQSADKTQGSRVQAGWGSKEPGFSEVSYSGQFAPGTYGRIFGKGFRRKKSMPVKPDEPLKDDWEVARFGGRIETVSARQSLTLIGDLYTGNAGQTLTITTMPTPPFEERVSTDADLLGGSILGRWERQIGTRSNVALQAYYDQSRRNEYILQGIIRNADIDFQHQFHLTNRYEIVWGLGYRLTADAFDGTSTFSLTPSSRKIHLWSGFIQNEFHLIPDRLRLAIGSKFEHNSYTNFEYQPNLRIWWSPNNQHAFWGAVARSVRTPSRAESDFNAIRVALPAGDLFPGSPIALARFFGNPNSISESVRSLDLGYRTNIQDRLSLDIAAFYNSYQNLRTNEPNIADFEIVPNPLHIVIPVFVGNKSFGNTYGFEASTDWQIHPSWRLKTVYSYIEMDLQLDEDSFDTEQESFEDDTPAHQLSMWLQVNLPGGWSTDLMGRFVDQLPAQNIHRYTTLDARLAWQATPALGVALVAQNLFDSPHREYISSAAGTVPSNIERLIYGVVDLHF